MCKDNYQKELEYMYVYININLKVFNFKSTQKYQFQKDLITAIYTPVLHFDP